MCSKEIGKIRAKANLSIGFIRAFNEHVSIFGARSVVGGYLNFGGATLGLEPLDGLSSFA